MNKNIIWLASYPKSGNTWLRSIISSLLYTNNGDFEFDLLKKINNFDRPFYYNDILPDPKKNNSKQRYSLDFLSQHRVAAQIHFNKKKEITFFKTHAANIAVNGFSYTSPQTTRGVIYMVRDPRDIVLSYSEFSKTTVQETVSMMKNKKHCVRNKGTGYTTLWSRWDYHVGSWFQLEAPKLLIKYEDMLDSPQRTILRIVNFLKTELSINLDISDQKILNILESTSFATLKDMENAGGFEEAADKNIRFFNFGEKNRWKKRLSKENIDLIEGEFKKTMSNFGYLDL